MEMPASGVKALEPHEELQQFEKVKVTWRTGDTPIAFVRSWHTGTQFDIRTSHAVKRL